MERKAFTMRQLSLKNQDGEKSFAYFTLDAGEWKGENESLCAYAPNGGSQERCE